jgi:hypothetical protein
MAASDERIVDLWVTRKQRAQNLRSLFETRWYESWEWYRNTKVTQEVQGQFWMHNRILPDAFRVIETMLPQHVLGTYGNNNWFSVEAPSVAGQTYQRVVKHLLLRGWRQMDGIRKSIIALKYAAIMGHVIPKLTWRLTLGEKEVQDIEIDRDSDGEPLDARFISKTIPVVRHNGPDIEIPDLFKMWKDNTDKGQWFIEQIDDNVENLKETNKDFGGALYKNLSTLNQYKSFQSTSQTSGIRTGTEAVWGTIGSTESRTPPSEAIDGISEAFRKEPDYVELWQCWGYVPPSVKRYDDTQWRLCVIANRDTLIRDVKAPTPDHRPPYWDVPSIVIPHQPYGDSVLSYIGDLIDKRSQIENFRLDEVLLNMFQQYIIDADSDVGPNDLFKMPGGALFVHNVKTRLQDVIVPVPRQPVMQDAYIESGQKEQQILETSGATEPFQGKSFGGRTTATEANLIANVGSGRFRLHTVWLDEVFKKPALERMFHFFQSPRFSDGDVIEVAEDPSMQDTISYRELEYDVDIHVDSGKFGSLDQSTIQALMSLYPVFSQDPNTSVYLKPDEILREIFLRAGFDRAHKFLRTPDEVAQIQQQQLQQQLLLAAASGAEQGGAETGETAGARRSV